MPKPTKRKEKKEIFETFLDLRKKLRRSIFRDDEVIQPKKKKKQLNNNESAVNHICNFLVFS